jgi:hypothetical protein
MGLKRRATFSIAGGPPLIRSTERPPVAGQTNVLFRYSLLPLTVRFTYRQGVIRIFGAGYWRRGKQLYEREN